MCRLYPWTRNLNLAGEGAIGRLGKQLDLLRQQVYDSEERLRFRDILGGIGFILGLAGVAFYLKARRRRSGFPA